MARANNPQPWIESRSGVLPGLLAFPALCAQHCICSIRGRGPNISRLWGALVRPEVARVTFPEARAPQDGQRGPAETPKRGQDASKTARERSKTSAWPQDGSRGPPRRPKRSPRGPPRGPQEANIIDPLEAVSKNVGILANLGFHRSKRASRTSNIAPVWPRRPSRELRNGPGDAAGGAGLDTQPHATMPTARVQYPQRALLGPGWLHRLWAHPPNKCRSLVPDRSAPSSSSSPSPSHSSLMVLSSSSFSASYP